MLRREHNSSTPPTSELTALGLGPSARNLNTTQESPKAQTGSKVMAGVQVRVGLQNAATV